MSWTLLVDPAVFKFLKRIPQRDAARIVSVIEGLGVNPYAGDIEKMKGEEDVWRRRVGAYRLFYEVLTSRRVVHVYRVERRTSTTYEGVASSLGEAQRQSHMFIPSPSRSIETAVTLPTF